MEDAEWLNDLRFKVSYGTTGNSAFSGDPYYPSLGLVGVGKYQGGSSFGISSVQNDDLTWEKAEITEYRYQHTHVQPSGSEHRLL